MITGVAGSGTFGIELESGGGPTGATVGIGTGAGAGTGSGFGATGTMLTGIVTGIDTGILTGVDGVGGVSAGSGAAIGSIGAGAGDIGAAGIPGTTIVRPASIDWSISTFSDAFSRATRSGCGIDGMSGVAGIKIGSGLGSTGAGADAGTMTGSTTYCSTGRMAGTGTGAGVIGAVAAGTTGDTPKGTSGRAGIAVREVSKGTSLVGTINDRGSALDAGGLMPSGVPSIRALLPVFVLITGTKMRQ